jgi:prepilin signal peptidase PulO-like enzyme (type II secretory pathway)
VEVEETIPFVPVIAMAVVLTAGFAGNLVPPLVRLIDWLSS